MTAGQPADLVIETDGLTKRYGDVVALDALTLRIPRGGVFGFLGPNGSGKTTTMGMLLGLVRPTSGEARILGGQAGQPETLRRIGALVETPTFYPYLSGRANLRYFQGIGARGTSEEIDRLLELVDLGKRARSKYATYSLGMKQRLGVACALLGDPELVFLDEPTTGFDPAARRTAWGAVRALRDLGKTVLLTTHYLDEANALSDRVAIVKDGRIVAEGPPGDLHGNSRYRVAYDVAGRRVEHETDDPTDLLNRLTSDAIARGERLEGLTVTRPTLEDVYLELTE